MKKIVLIIFLLVGSISLYAKDPGESFGRINILIINSYHKGFTWSDSILEGFINHLDSTKYNFQYMIEYMDSRRYHDEDYYSLFKEIIFHKYSNKKIDFIITTDDNAYDFMFKYKDEIAPNVPLLFAGLNKYDDSRTIKNSTGILETIDLMGTFALIRNYHKAANKFVFITDQSLTSKRIVNEIRNHQIYKRHNSIITIIDSLDILDASKYISTLDDSTIAFLLPYSIDKNNRLYDYSKSAEILLSNAKIPVYTFWDFYLNHGILGGKLIIGKMHGNKLASMLIQVISKQTLPAVHMDFLGDYVFDYNYLRKYEIDESKLPSNFKIINEPEKFYKIDKPIFWIIFISIILLSLLTLFIYLSYLRRKKAEEALKVEEAKLKSSLSNEKLLSEIASILNYADDFRSNLEYVLRICINHFPLCRISIFEVDSKINSIDNLFLVNSDNTISKEPIELSRIDLDKILVVIKKSGNLIINDVENFSNQFQISSNKIKFQSGIISGLKVNNQTIGLILYLKKEKYTWQQNEIDLFNGISNIIANFWERFKQFDARLKMEIKHNDTLRMLEESSKMASIGVMAAGITHEINQPLNAIKVTTDSTLFQFKRNTQLDPRIIQNKLSQISEGADRIDEIIKHMRDFWVQPKNSNLELMDLNSIVTNALSLVQRQIYDHQIKPKVDLYDGVLNIHAISIQLEQVIINLIINAIQSLDNINTSEKSIFIISGIKDEKIFLEISDNGIGIDENAVEEIFNPFFTTKIKNKGSGLGLAIVKNFIDKLNGEIFVSNNELGGATFKILFPINLEK